MALSTTPPGLDSSGASAPEGLRQLPTAAGPPPKSEPWRHHLTNMAIALSTGCLLFVRRWYDLERLEPRSLGYLRAAPIDRTLLAATTAAVLITSAIFWLAWTWVERHATPVRRRIGHVVFLLVMLSSLESVRRYWNSEGSGFDAGSNLALAVVEGLLASGLVLMFFGRPRILMATRRVALLLTLLVPGLILDFASNVADADGPQSFENRTNLPMLPAAAKPAARVVWVVFDELDERFAFDARPAGLDLPELDRLRSESVAASHAAEISSWTAVSLPSLISGRKFESAQMMDAGTLRLMPQGGHTEVDWRGQPNVFQRARELGRNAALVGWHHPYCRVLGDEVVRCFALPSSHSTTALEQELQAAHQGVIKTVGGLFWRAGLNVMDLFRASAKSVSERSNEAMIQREQQQQYFALRDRAYRDAADPALDLVFVHLPTPHMFPIYNRRGRNFDLSGARDYFDNLALVDRTVGELRTALEKAGLWDRTALLITADHGFRPDAWRGRTGWTPEFDRLTAGGASLTVPLILKLPGRPQHAGFDAPISNVVSADLVLAVLSGEVAAPEQAIGWLERHAAGAKSTELQSATAVLR